MTRKERLIGIARGLGACESGLEAARTMSCREIIDAYGWWILINLRHRLHRRELWRVVKRRPDSAVIMGWDAMTPEMRDWVEERYPEIILKFSGLVDPERVQRCVSERPSFALEHLPHLLPDCFLNLAARLRPDAALDYAARYLAPEVFWECAQKSDRLRRPQRQAYPDTHVYYVIHVRGGWHMIRSENDPVFVPAATAREARQLAIEDAKNQPTDVKSHIIQFAVGDRPRYKEIVL